jgi:tRNA pseudouridine38-40 synthase
MSAPGVIPSARGRFRNKMTHWKLTLSYDGGTFHGWQVQPGKPTIQGTLRDALTNITGETVFPQGSGRTDAGVHALAQVASFDLTITIPPANLLTALNRALPPSIRVLSAEIASDEFHARHSARLKSYEYRIFPRSQNAIGEDCICFPFLAPYVWDCRWKLNLALMQQAAAHFCGAHDFTSFAAADPDLAQRATGAGPNPVKTLYTSACVAENGLILYRVAGTGFLHHMVRNIVGTLVEVGRGATLPEDIPEILAARNRVAAGPTAPPQGLFLVEVGYDK